MLKGELTVHSEARNFRTGRCPLYLLFFWKKIRDSKIRTKLMVYLILVAVICSGVIGYMSYMTMRESLIHIAEDSASSLLKQVSVRVEESIQDFQDSTYSFVNRPEIQNLLTRKKEPEKSPWKDSRDQLDLSGSFLSMTALYKYADMVILETGEKEIYYYDQAPADQKITAGQAGDIMTELRSQVTSAVPIKWVKKDGRVYFVRQVADTKQKPGSQPVGTAVFVIADAFFDLREDENIYVSNQNTMICGKEGAIYKNNHLQMTEQALKPYLSYKDGKYYIYSAMRKINNKEYLTITVRTHRLGWNILCMTPYSVILKEADQVIPRIAAAALLLLGAGLLVGSFLYHFLQKNLKIIEQGMLQYESGNYSARLSPASYDEIGLLILQFNHMGMKISELNEQARREEEKRQELQYQVMEAQINPHFLYNTLGSLKWLAFEKEQHEIVTLADAVIRLLRFTVKNANRPIPLKEELDYIRDYIHIQQMRYENSFRVYFSVTDDAQNYTIIGFILQPFIENSILHGLDNARSDGIIRIEGFVDKGCLILSAADNGMGMSQEKLSGLLAKIQENKTEKYKGFNGIGIVNIILRLKMVYGTEFQYQLESFEGAGTKMTLRIPERISEDEEESIDRRG